MNTKGYEELLEKEYNHINKVTSTIYTLEDFLIMKFQNIEFEDIASDKLQEAVSLIDDITEYRETFKNNLSKISSIIDQIDKSSHISEGEFLKFSSVENTVTQAFSNIEKIFLDYYKKSNISKISCIQKDNQLFNISVKVKMIPEELILTLVKQKKYIKLNNVTELNDSSENYRFLIYANSLIKNLSEQTALLQDFIETLQKELINSEIYRPFVYEHMKDMMLSNLYPPSQPTLYNVDTNNARKWQLDALSQFIGTSDKDPNFKNKYHLICEAGTGTGKTRFSLMCIAEILKKNPNAKIRIIVPKIILMHQWAKELKKVLHVPPDKIRLMGGSMCSIRQRDNFNVDFSIYVINTARKYLVPDTINSIQYEQTSNFIVTDECHHYYSEKNIQIFNGFHKYNRNPDNGIGYYSLALSATPYSWNYKESDLLKKLNLFTRENITREHIMYEILGPGKYTYGLLHAIADQVVAPLKIVNVDCKLTDLEKVQYGRLNKKLKNNVYMFQSALLDYYVTGNDIPEKYGDEEKLIRLAINISRGEQKIIKEIQEQNPKGTKATKQTYINIEKWLNTKDPFYKVVYTASIVNGIIIQIEEFINNCESRKRKCINLGETHQNDKVILFSESIKSTDFIYEELSKLIGEEKTLKYHSKVDLAKIMKRRIIAEKIPKEELMASYLGPFKNGTVNVLCTAKVFDEGIDMPNANVGIIFQGTENERQNLQRVGRIIRKNSEGDNSKVATIYWLYNSECNQKPFLNCYFDKIEKSIEEAESSGLPLSEDLKKSKRGLGLIEELYEIVECVPQKETIVAELGN